MINLADVRIVPYRPESGRAIRGVKHVLVGDVPFGVIAMQGVGGRGNYYWFQQAGREGLEIYRPGKRCPQTVRVFGDYIARQHASLSDTDRGKDLPSIDERLLIEARKLIEEGLLVSKPELEERDRKEHEAWRRKMAKIKEKEDAKFRERAAKVVSDSCIGLAPTIKDMLVDEIIRAMRWAQTK